MTKRFGEGIRAGVRRLFVPALRAPRRTHADMDAEFRAHVEARVQHLIARGFSPEDARVEATRRIGAPNIDAAIATLQSSALTRERRLGVREQLGSIAQDTRFVVRGLGRNPVFTAGVVATLTLGLGINSAVFRIADRVLLRAPGGVTAPGTLRRVYATARDRDGSPTFGTAFSYQQAHTIAQSAALQSASLYVTGRPTRNENGHDITSVYVDSGFFRLLGVKPFVGRLFDAFETELGGELPVGVVSYDYWQRELGGAALSASSTIKYGDLTVRIVGVMPSAFTGLDLDPVDVWLPFGIVRAGRSVVNGVTIPWYQSGMMQGTRILARVAANVGDDVIARQLSTTLAALDINAGRTTPRAAVLRPLVSTTDVSGNNTSGRLVGRLSGVALLVLLIACANAANLLLARAVRRRKEIAVRLALGGSRARIMRLLIVEGVVLGLLGGLTAAIVGYWTGDGLRRLIFPDARWTTTALDDRTLLFTMLAALVAGLAVGLAPAAQLSATDLVTSLKDDRRASSERGRLTRAMLVIVQTAFSLALLIASGLLVRSLMKLNDVSMGFEPSALVSGTTSRAFTRLSGIPLQGDFVSAADAAERLKNNPDIRGIALASVAPFGARSSMDITIPGREIPEMPDGLAPSYSAVSPNYFTVLGTRLRIGRLFSSGDTRGSDPVAIVNESMARQYWQGASPFGSCILLTGGRCVRVVGIVEDIRDVRGGDAPPMRFYLPSSQSSDSVGAVIVRAVSTRTPAVVASLRATIPSAQRPTIEVVSDRIDRAMRPWRLATLLFVTLGAIAVLLAGVGVYSVMSYIASERVHEIGVRMALGATATDIARGVIGGGVRLTLVGAAIGLAGAAAGARLLSSLLFGVSPFDPLVYAIAVIGLTLMGVIATLVPALRAMRTDPTVALRAE